jgi:Transposase, Mutator family
MPAIGARAVFFAAHLASIYGATGPRGLDQINRRGRPECALFVRCRSRSRASSLPDAHGIDIAERCHVVALGITTDGVKIPLGLWEGSTENATVARSLLSDLVERDLDPEQAILFVIDGGNHVGSAHDRRLQQLESG